MSQSGFSGGQVISHIYVPDEGPKDAKVLLVGEAPGEDEELQRRPFVGKSGRFLEGYLKKAGLNREEVYFSNLCHHRPLRNNFLHLIESKELEDGLDELNETIRTVNPNLVVTLGNWPMYYLTGKMAPSKRGKPKPGTGVSLWRGSLVEGGSRLPEMFGRKTLITYHPSYIIRPDGFSQNPLFLHDIKKIGEEKDFDSIRPLGYRAIIDPINLWEIARDMAQSEWLSVDIETFGDSLACIGFADSDERALCITLNHPLGWDAAWFLLASDTKKIFQFGTFDINYLKHYYGVETLNYAFDTYIATANLLPEFKRGLDFLTSIYTKFPFYKEDLKTWKQKGDLKILWEYNCKDVIATYQIAMEQMKGLREIYGQAA